MSEPAHSGNGNGNQQTTIVQAGLRLGSQVVHALAPQFLSLLLVNVMVLGVLFWFVDARARHTAQVLNQLLTACLTRQP
jgi:hypothetical protein